MHRPFAPLELTEVGLRQSLCVCPKVKWALRQAQCVGHYNEVGS